MTGTEVTYFLNCAQTLEKFLKMHANEVENVHLGYVTDFFQDVNDPRVDQIRLEVLEVLCRYEVHISCLTKGKPSDGAITLINKMRDRFTIMMDVGCGNPSWERNVMPRLTRLAASEKLECMKGARLDPIIPGVNDSDKFFHELVDDLVDVGIFDIDTSFLFLTDDVQEAVSAKLGEDRLEELYKYYITGCEEFLNGAVAWTGQEVDMEDIRYKIDTIALPSPDIQYRKETIERFKEIAEAKEVTVRLCNCKNRSMKGFTGCCTDSRNLHRINPESPEGKLMSGPTTEDHFN